MGAANAADCRAATRDPVVVRGMLADYRAGLEFDYAHDEEDRLGGRRLQCPLAVFWSAWDDMERLYGDPSEPWSDWAAKIVMRQKIMSGHHMAEETPEAVAQHLGSFFGDICRDAT